MLTQKELKRLFHYDPDTGVFTRWCASLGIKTGYHHKGYLIIKVNGTKYQAHRLAWLYMTGEWPDFDVDHKDMVKSNNAWNNLRKATRSQNKQNGLMYSTNKSGYKGVCWHKHSQKWVASCTVNYRKHHIGLFVDVEDAAKAYQDFAKKHHGEFARF